MFPKLGKDKIGISISNRFPGGTPCCFPKNEELKVDRLKFKKQFHVIISQLTFSVEKNTSKTFNFPNKKDVSRVYMSLSDQVRTSIREKALFV